MELTCEDALLGSSKNRCIEVLHVKVFENSGRGTFALRMYLCYITKPICWMLFPQTKLQGPLVGCLTIEIIWYTGIIVGDI